MCDIVQDGAAAGPWSKRISKVQQSNVLRIVEVRLVSKDS